MIEVTFKFGLSKAITIDVDDCATVSDVLRNPNNKAVLGYPENVSVINDGVTLSLDDQLEDGGVYVIEKLAAAKA